MASTPVSPAGISLTGTESQAATGGSSATPAYGAPGSRSQQTGAARAVTEDLPGRDDYRRIQHSGRRSGGPQWTFTDSGGGGWDGDE